MRLLLVEDNRELADWLGRTLRKQHYTVDWVDNGSDADFVLRSETFDLVLLDLSLPKLDGQEVLRRLRARGNRTPVLVLTADNTTRSRVSELDHGADDYVAKPFAVGELLARIRAALRRAAPLAPDGADPIVRFGNVQADFEKRLITVGGQEVHLTPNEYKLLQVLIKHAGRVVTQRQLLNEVWGPQHTEQSQYLRVYVAQLRRKLEQDPARPRYLQTEPGVGYRLSFDR